MGHEAKSMHQYKMVILLEDFENSDEESLPDSIELAHGWALSKTETLDLPANTFEYFGKLISPFHQEKLSSTKFTLINQFELGKEMVNEFMSSDEQKLRAFQSHWIGTALRLIRPGHFVMHRIILRRDEDKEWQPVQSFLIRDKYYQPAGFEGLDNLYSNSDTQKIKDYSAYLINLATLNEGKHHRVLNALDLFNEALKQYRYDTKLILLVSAIESLFNFSKGQTTEKLAFGASRFIEPNTSDRLRLYNEVKDLYNVRSALIHGSKLEKIRKQVFYSNIPLQKEIARLAYDVVAKSSERIIHEDLADDFNNSKLLAKEYIKANLGDTSHIFK